MNTNLQQRGTENGTDLQRYDYADATLLVADLGLSAGEASVDVVDGTAIVVTRDRQREFDLPTREATATINNGVFTIEVTR
jgi:hypothetical protein